MLLGLTDGGIGGAETRRQRRRAVDNYPHNRLRKPRTAWVLRFRRFQRSHFWVRYQYPVVMPWARQPVRGSARGGAVRQTEIGRPLPTTSNGSALIKQNP